MATALSTPFYIDLGFTKTEIGLVAKNAALWPAIFGGLAGGLLMIKLGINRALWIFGGVQLFSIFGFAILAYYTPTLWLLAIVVGFEYLGVGLGTAAFAAFIARETSRVFAATQFALFTAMASIPRAVTSASTGFIVDEIGWYRFFFCVLFLQYQGMLLLIWVAPWKEKATFFPTKLVVITIKSFSSTGCSMIFSRVRLANLVDAPNTKLMKYLIVIYPFIELISLIQLGIETSAFWALAYVIGMSCFGLTLIRRQGLALISELKNIESGRGILSILQAGDLRIVIAGLLFLIRFNFRLFCFHDPSWSCLSLCNEEISGSN